MFSHSAHKCYKQCPKKRWWQYEWNGTGLVPAGDSMALSTGKLVHRMFQYLMKGGSVDAVVAKAIAEEKENLSARGYYDGEIAEQEQEFALAEALLRAWHRIRYDALMERYSIVEVEEEHLITREIDGREVEFMCKLGDCLLRDRESGELVPMDFKTHGSNHSNYYDSWNYSTQTMLHSWATEQLYGEPTGNVMMEFLFKGRRYEGKYSNKLIYCLRKPMGIDYEYRHDYPPHPKNPEWKEKKGWEQVPVWQEMGVKAWLDELPDSELLEYINWRTIMHDPRAEVEYVYQMFEIEADLIDADLTMWWGHFDESCYNDRYNKRCPYIPLCWDGRQPESLIELGEFKAREPHYDLEVNSEE